MIFNNITINDKNILNKYLKNTPYGITEFSFTALFIWNHVFKIKYLINDDRLYLASFANNQIKFLPIIDNSNIKKDIDFMLNYAKNNNFQFEIISVSDEIIKDIEKVYNEKFQIINIDLYDYIYLSDDLINLKGKKFASKRNHIKKFDSIYNYEYLEVNENNVNLLKQTLIKWADSYGELNESLEQEIYATNLALDNFKNLDLIGGAIKINDEVVAFTFGQAINNETFVVHVEKALSEYNGLYTKINNEFATRNLSNFKYINREEDLGVPGLRKAKQSYNPVNLYYKNSIVLK